MGGLFLALMMVEYSSDTAQCGLITGEESPGTAGTRRKSIHGGSLQPSMASDGPDSAWGLLASGSVRDSALEDLRVAGEDGEG